MNIRWIVIHTAAAKDRHGNIRRGITAEVIRQWHLERRTKSGKRWTDIGYHYVIEDDGKVVPGREEDHPGAHVHGLNTEALGICCTGHGDLEDFNRAQYDALIPLVIRELRERGLDHRAVIGHREVGLYTDAPIPHKTCPGTKVSMDWIRALVKDAMEQEEAPENKPDNPKPGPPVRLGKSRKIK